MEKFIPSARFHTLNHFFDYFCILLGLGKNYRKEVIKSLDLPKEDIVILDAGCGTGSLAIEIKQEKSTTTIYGVDIDPKIISIAKKKANKKNLAINFEVSPIQKLPFKDKSIDIVYSSLVFHHLSQKIKIEALKEIHRTIKDNGYFLLADFGKPKNKLPSLSWLTMIFEEGYDNYKGNLPKMIKDSGFKNVEIVSYKRNIDLIKAYP